MVCRCVFELWTAVEMGVPVTMVQTAESVGGYLGSWSTSIEDVVMNTANVSICSFEARCGNPNKEAPPEEMDTRAKIEQHPEGYKALDLTIEKLRLQALLDRPGMACGGMAPDIHWHWWLKYDHAINAICKRIGFPTMDVPEDPSSRSAVRRLMSRVNLDSLRMEHEDLCRQMLAGELEVDNRVISDS